AVAFDSKFRQVHHLGISAGVLHLLDEILAAFKTRTPICGPASLYITEMIAEHDERWNLCQRGNLCSAHSGAWHFDRDHAFDARGINQCRLLGEKAGLGVAHQDGSFEFYGKRG